MFDKTSLVNKLTPENINLSSDKITHHLLTGKNKGLVMFGASWCGYCKRASPEFAKASNLLGNAIPLYYIDCEKYPELGTSVDGYPTFKIINKSGKLSKKTLIGPRNCSNFIKFVTKLR